MVKDEFEEFMEMLKLEVSKPKYQKEIREVITNKPDAYREMVEAQELGFADIMKTEDGYRQNNKPAPQGSIDAALHRADERMLRESPFLFEHKLRFSGGLLVPDEKEYKKIGKELAKSNKK